MGAKATEPVAPTSVGIRAPSLLVRIRRSRSLPLTAAPIHPYGAPSPVPREKELGRETKFLLPGGGKVDATADGWGNP